MVFVIANQEKVNAMIKTTLKIDGMMCGMCESHMNDLIRKNFQVKKVTSSAKDGETVIISDNEIDIPWAKKEIKEIGYELVSHKSEPYEKKWIFPILENNRNIWKNTGKMRRCCQDICSIVALRNVMLQWKAGEIKKWKEKIYDKAENYKGIYIFSVGDNKTSMLRLKENIGSLSGIQAVALSNPIYEWPLGEFSPDGTYESYTSEDGDEEIMEVMGYKLLKGLPWKEAIERFPHPVYLNRTWAQSLFPDGELPVGSLIKEYEPRLKDASFW